MKDLSSCEFSKDLTRFNMSADSRHQTMKTGKIRNYPNCLTYTVLRQVHLITQVASHIQSHLVSQKLCILEHTSIISLSDDEVAVLLAADCGLDGERLVHGLKIQDIRVVVAVLLNVSLDLPHWHTSATTYCLIVDTLH